MPLSHAVRVLLLSPPFLTLSFLYTTQSQPLEIQSVEIIRKNILDEGGEGSVFTNIMNGVHTITSEDVIKRELLFAEGEHYDRGKIDESVRNLRTMGLFSEVSVQTDTLPGDRALVRVITRERWTMRAAAMVKQEAGIRSGIAGISEDNLLGGGQKISLYSTYSSVRNNPYGFQAALEERRLFGSRWRSVLQYHNAEEFRLSSLQVERPFYSEDAEWAGGVVAARTRERLWYVHTNPENERSFRRTTSLRLWYARSSGRELKLRWGVAYHRVRMHTLPEFLTASGMLDLVNASIGVMKREYEPVSFVDQIGSVEYASTGFSLSAVGGFNLTGSAEMTNLGFFRLGSRAGVRLRKGLLLYSDLVASAYTNFSRVRDAVISWNASFLQKVGERHTTVGRLKGITCFPHGQIILGGFTGLRGYGPYDFVGSRGAMINLEHRFFPDLQLWYFQPGVPFFWIRALPGTRTTGLPHNNGATPRASV